MSIDDRKKKILNAIISDYINTAEPIGSRTIAKKYELGLSSATIRNEMADLEELGYLAQPHTSAGRIPSDKGYRLYVDELLHSNNTENGEKDTLSFETDISELHQVIRLASVMISQMTQYISVITSPKMEQIKVKALQVVPVDTNSALVILVVNGGVVRNTLLKLNAGIRPDVLIQISNYLNERLSGNSLLQLKQKLSTDQEVLFGIEVEVLQSIYRGILSCIDQFNTADIYLDGTTNIFNYPEFRDHEKAKQFIHLLDEKSTVMKVIKVSNSQSQVQVQIGRENSLEEMQEYSLVTSNYGSRNSSLGCIGIIGPTRMDYAKVISAMKLIRKTINEEINKLISE